MTEVKAYLWGEIGNERGKTISAVPTVFEPEV